MYGNDWYKVNPHDIMRQVELHGHVRIAPSEPIPGPNPGGVTAEELGEGWELCEHQHPLEGLEWFSTIDRKWYKENLCHWKYIDKCSWRRPKKQEQPTTNEQWSKHPLVQAAATEALRQEIQPTPPDPGPGYRLVDTKTEKPRDDAEVFFYGGWAPDGAYINVKEYDPKFYYRVPLTKRLVPPIGEELLGQKVRLSQNPEDACLVVAVKVDGWMLAPDLWADFDEVAYMTHGQRTDPKTGEWIPWAKEVWE